MKRGIQIEVVYDDYDPFLVVIHLQASNERFAGSTRIYAGVDELDDFVRQIDGFPSNPNDERIYEFGSRGPSTAGGYVRLRFHCTDRAAHAAIDMFVEEDVLCYIAGHAQLSLRVEAAGIDHFVEQLREIQKAHSGHATLPLADKRIMSQESKDKKQRIGSKGKPTLQAQAEEGKRRQRWANLREELDRFAAALPPFDDSAALIREDRENH